MIPMNARQTLAADIRAAAVLASEGQLVLGYDVLLEGRDRTLEALEAGYVWAPALLTAYRQAIRQYERAQGCGAIGLYPAATRRKDDQREPGGATVGTAGRD